METEIYPLVSAYLQQPLRTMEQALESLEEKFERLPLQHPDRADLARQIRLLEGEIMARQPL